MCVLPFADVYGATYSRSPDSQNLYHWSHLWTDQQKFKNCWRISGLRNFRFKSTCVNTDAQLMSQHQFRRSSVELSFSMNLYKAALPSPPRPRSDTSIKLAMTEGIMNGHILSGTVSRCSQCTWMTYSCPFIRNIAVQVASWIAQCNSVAILKMHFATKPSYLGFKIPRFSSKYKKDQRCCQDNLFRSNRLWDLFTEVPSLLLDSNFKVSTSFSLFRCHCQMKLKTCCKTRY